MLRAANLYDNFGQNIAELIEKQEKKLKPYQEGATTQSVYKLWRDNFVSARVRLYFMAFLLKTGLWDRIIFSHFSLSWFYRFRKYWSGELGNRMIFPHDFYYLYGIYRGKFADASEKKNLSNEGFLDFWQQPFNIFQVFSYVYKSVFYPLKAYKIAKYLPKGAKVCEYGCGVAPITQSLIRYYARKKLQLHCADIPNALFHYMRWQFKDYDFVKKIKIDPKDLVPLQEDYDMITLTTVLEHLPEPLIIIKHVHQRLKPKGVLVFDYVLSEADGHDTKNGLLQRDDVLNFIKANFEVLEGEIYLDGRDLPRTIVRKK